jgi:hypothetical protein
MARLTHVQSGAVVEVADEKVERLGSEWEPVKAETKKAPAKKAAAKSTDK